MGFRITSGTELLAAICAFLQGMGLGPAATVTKVACWVYPTLEAPSGTPPLTFIKHRNMDIVGVAGIAAEAELLAAICAFLQRVGLGPADVVIKVSSRGVLRAVLARHELPDAAIGPVAVVIDKMDKLPLAKARRRTLPCPAFLQVNPGACSTGCGH